MANNSSARNRQRPTQSRCPSTCKTHSLPRHETLVINTFRGSHVPVWPTGWWERGRGPRHQGICRYRDSHQCQFLGRYCPRCMRNLRAHQTKQILQSAVLLGFYRHGFFGEPMVWRGVTPTQNRRDAGAGAWAASRALRWHTWPWH